MCGPPAPDIGRGAGGRVAPGWAAVTLSGSTGSLGVPTCSKGTVPCCLQPGAGGGLSYSSPRPRRPLPGPRGCLGLASVRYTARATLQGPSPGGSSSICSPLVVISRICVDVGAFLAKHTCRMSRGILLEGCAPRRCTCVWLGRPGAPGPGESVSCVWVQAGRGTWGVERWKGVPAGVPI